MAELARREFLGALMVAEPPSRVIDYLLDALSGLGGGVGAVHLVPAHGFAQAEEDAAFRDILASGDVVIPDGRWLEILTRSDEVPLYQLRGTDLFLGLVDRGRDREIRHYFLGSSDELNQSLLGLLPGQFPGVAIVGSEEYPFEALSDEQKEALASRVAASGAQVVWFGISTPRQNIEARWLSEAAGVTVICVGAALEFVAGKKKAAPRWMQRLGLEWLFRFSTEPRRLWRRYVIGSILFLRLYFSYRRRGDGA